MYCMTCARSVIQILLYNQAVKKNESSAMIQMIERYNGDNKTIFIADRGYEAYNIFAHVQEQGMYYLIRVKDGSSSMTGSFNLPCKDDKLYQFLGRQQSVFFSCSKKDMTKNEQR